MLALPPDARSAAAWLIALESRPTCFAAEATDGHLRRTAPVRASSCRTGFAHGITPLGPAAVAARAVFFHVVFARSFPSGGARRSAAAASSRVAQRQQ